MLTPVGSNPAKDEVILFFFLQIQLSGQIDMADAVQNVVKEPQTQHFHSGLFTVLSGVMMIDHLQFHQFHGLVDNPAIDQNSSKTSSKEKTPPPFPNYNNNERDKSFNNKKPL